MKSSVKGCSFFERCKDSLHPCIFSKENIKIMAYTLETILAEKYETIIRRNITTIRMRDFYDLYILYKLKKDEMDYEILKEAIERTSSKRGSREMMKDYEGIIEGIKEDSYLRSLWDVYLSFQNAFADEMAHVSTLSKSFFLFKKSLFLFSQFNFKSFISYSICHR